MSSDVNRYRNLPGNSLVTAVVDGWWFEEFGFLEGVVLLLNRTINLVEAGVQLYDLGTPGYLTYEAGSVKMGQPILHPVRHFPLPGTIWANELGGTDKFRATWFKPQFGGTPPGPYTLLVYEFHGFPPFKVPVSPLFYWRDLRKSNRTGGY